MQMQTQMQMQIQMQMQMQESSNQSNSKYWLKILFNNKEYRDVLLLNDVSVDFIRGVCFVRYCILNEPQYSKNNYTDLVLTSNAKQFQNYYYFVTAPIVIRWPQSRRDNELEKLCGFNNNDDRKYFCHNTMQYHREKILKNAKKYNIRLKEFLKEFLNQLSHPDKTPSKRYIAYICIIGPIIRNYTIQFKSIDFLNGFEHMRMWMNNISKRLNWRYRIILKSVYDSGKICKTFVTYQLPQKEKNDIEYLNECINEYLPKYLRQIIMSMITKCDNRDEYDECLTLCINDSCYVHQKASNAILKLSECITKIDLEQI